jgi:hypothetical protein
MRGRGEAKFCSYNLVYVLVPESWCFWMALERFVDLEDVSPGNGWTSQTVLPPVAELVVYIHI